MFGVGIPEMAVLAFLAVLVFGPDKLPGLAKDAAGMVKHIKRLADSARDELREQLGPEFSDLEFSDLNPRAAIRRHLTEAMENDDEDVSNTAIDPIDDANLADPIETVERKSA
jgi:sec-independent protein translocase protein TatB